MATAPEVKKGITEEQQQELDEVFARAHKALAIIETYDQARVDRLCQAVAWAVANKQTFTRLVDMGIKESGLGDAVSRMGKRMKIRGVLRDALRQKSVGIIEELPEKGIVKYGKPVGIIACIVPTTNPDLTPAGNAIYGIKARDCVIFSPHPRSKKTSFETVRLMREALEREGAPADILQCLTKVNIPMSQALMARADLIVATGGQPMVRAAYSSGTPAYGVGAGNSTMIIDETANIEEAARNTRLSKTSDFGSGCSADGNLIIEASIFDKLLAQLQKEGGYLASPQEKEMLRKAMWDDERHRTVETVAIAPQQLAEGRGLHDPGRPQVHHRPRRRHRQGTPLLQREADHAARRLQVQGLRPGARDDARHLRSGRQGPFVRRSTRSTRITSIASRWRHRCRGSWSASRSRRPTPARSTTGCR